MSNVQYTTPSTKYQAASEDQTYSIDCTAALGGATPVVQSVVLYYLNRTVVPLVDAPVVIGNLITQRIRAGVLSPGPSAQYQLVALWSPSGTTNVYESILIINCTIS